MTTACQAFKNHIWWGFFSCYTNTLLKIWLLNYLLILSFLKYIWWFWEKNSTNINEWLCINLECTCMKQTLSHILLHKHKPLIFYKYETKRQSWKQRLFRKCNKFPLASNFSAVIWDRHSTSSMRPPQQSTID